MIKIDLAALDWLKGLTNLVERYEINGQHPSFTRSDWMREIADFGILVWALPHIW